MGAITTQAMLVKERRKSPQARSFSPYSTQKRQAMLIGESVKVKGSPVVASGKWYGARPFSCRPKASAHKR